MYNKMQIGWEASMMQKIEELETFRDRLRRQLLNIGDFRPGTVYPSYRKCGKRNCACARPAHPGHLQYLRTTARGGKHRSQVLRMGPELQEALREAENFQRFTRICRELVQINEQICALRPLREVKDAEEFKTLKNKLQRRFAGKLRKI
jgi:hypothetical protein